MARMATFTLLTLVCATLATPKPHIISILQDDLGYYDTGIHSESAAKFTQNITALAREGIILTNHYTVCEPK